MADNLPAAPVASDIPVMDRGSVTIGTLVDALALVYAEGYSRSAPEAVAKVADNELDRSGQLLGRVRDRAWEITQARRLVFRSDR
jgi:hypothetical protein